MCVCDCGSAGSNYGTRNSHLLIEKSKQVSQDNDDGARKGDDDLLDVVGSFSG